MNHRWICILITCAAAFLPAVRGFAEEEGVNPYAGVDKLKQSLKVPAQFESVHDFSPVTYLDMFTAEETARFLDKDGKLSGENKEALVALFEAAQKSCLKKYKQEYYLQKTRPICKLLATAFPAIGSLESEPEGSVRMSQILEVISPEEKEKKTTK